MKTFAPKCQAVFERVEQLQAWNVPVFEKMESMCKMEHGKNVPDPPRSLSNFLKAFMIEMRDKRAKMDSHT